MDFEDFDDIKNEEEEDANEEERETKNGMKSSKRLELARYE